MPPARKKAASTVIDLDAARKARAEKDTPQGEIRLGGQTFTLPAEMPADFALLAMEGDLRGAVRALLDGQSDDFFATGPSVPDLEELVKGVNDMYGVKPGEAVASPSS